MNKEISIDFMKYLHPKSNYKTILFVVKSLEENINMRVINIITKEMNCFKVEEEMLFLTFFGFEILEIKKENKYTTIYIKYLNKYKKVKDYIEARNKDKV